MAKLKKIMKEPKKKKILEQGEKGGEENFL